MASESQLARRLRSLYVLICRCRIDSSTRAVMADQIVITEKSSQANDVRAAVGSRYGAILPAEGHLFDLLEPEDVVPAWKRWSPILLRPDGLYGTRPAEGGNKAAKLRAICEALRTAKRVWLTSDQPPQRHNPFSSALSRQRPRSRRPARFARCRTANLVADSAIRRVTLAPAPTP